MVRMEVNILETGRIMSGLLAEYEQQRQANHRLEQQRIAEVCERSPKAEALILERSTAFNEGRREAFAYPGRAGDIAIRLIEKIGGINAQLREELKTIGFPEDFLQPVYRCADCQDTGFIGDVVREKCACLRQRLMDAENKSERTGGLGSHTFAQFDLNVFPDDPIPGERFTQRSYMQRVRRLAEQYAQDFPDNERPNLVFSGGTGLGKTFLADCIASAVMDRAYLVRRVTSYRMSEIMKRNAFDGSDARAVEALMACDLLFVDDLGTEPIGKNTVGYLFQIVNERNNPGRHTIVSTNLTPVDLTAIYGERVTSRILDTSRTTLVKFYGQDIRLQRRHTYEKA